MRSHRLAAPGLALVLGAAGVLAIGGAALAVSPNKPANPAPALGAPAAAETTNYCGTVPLDVEIILDTSGSMGTVEGTKTRLGWAEAAATQLVDQLAATSLGVGGASGHHIGLTVFHGSAVVNNSNVHVVLPLGTSTATDVDNAITNGLSANDSTPFKLGMATGAKDLIDNDRSDADQVIIFLSDGRPNPDQTGSSGKVATDNSSQRPTQADLVSFLGSADKIYSIAIGTANGGTGSSDVDLGLMQLLATSGDYHNVTASGLPALFGNIYTQIACPSLVITASSDTMTYGGAVPTITPSYSAFVPPDTEASLTTAPTCTTTATSSSPVGTYPSICKDAVDPNYNITYLPGTVTVTPAPLVITASLSVRLT